MIYSRVICLDHPLSYIKGNLVPCCHLIRCIWYSEVAFRSCYGMTCSADFFKNSNSSKANRLASRLSRFRPELNASLDDCPKISTTLSERLQPCKYECMRETCPVYFVVNSWTSSRSQVSVLLKRWGYVISTSLQVEYTLARLLRILWSLNQYCL
jgi:hypothetical protein